MLALHERFGARVLAVLVIAATVVDVLRIGFGIASIFGLLPEVVLRFRRAHPDVQFHLRDMSTPDQIDALVSGEIDVGF